jgi:hypothetical protein
MNQPAPASPQPMFTLNISEFGRLTGVSEQFATLSIVLLHHGAGHPMYDQCVAHLQREREFLAKFTGAARTDKMPAPIEVLDMLAKKQYPTIAVNFLSALECARVNLFFQRVIRNMLKVVVDQNQTLAKSAAMDRGATPLN